MENVMEREYYKKLKELEEGPQLTRGSLEKLAQYSGTICSLLESCSSIHTKLDKDAPEVDHEVSEIYEILEENPQFMNTIYDVFKNLYNRKYHPFG